MRSPSPSASSRRGDAIDVARGGIEVEGGIAVSVGAGADDDDDDDDGAGDDRDSAQPTNAPPPSTTTTRKKDERSRFDRIPVLSYQNDYVIVSKPCGMTMHRNSNTRWGRPKGPVLEAAVRRQLGRRPYLVHRLDHRTSGACLLGFASEKAAELHGRLRGEGAIKLYVALVRGDLRERFRRAAASAGSVGGDDGVGEGANADDGYRGAIGSRGRIPDVMVGEGRQPSERSLNDDDEYRGKITVNLPIKVTVEGIEIEKDASTEFYFLSSLTDEDDDVDGPSEKDETGSSTAARYVNKSLTLLLCHPRTGRTHQIRRHLQKALAAPIIGDVEHGDSRVNRYWRENVGLDRLGLHCWYLGLPPPQAASPPPPLSSDGDDEVIECLAPLTLDFAGALRHEKLGPLWSEALRAEPRLGAEPYDERGGTFGRNFRRRR